MHVWDMTASLMITNAVIAKHTKLSTKSKAVAKIADRTGCQWP